MTRVIKSPDAISDVTHRMSLVLFGIEFSLNSPMQSQVSPIASPVRINNMILLA